MTNKKIFQILSKLSLIMVIIGFFQPLILNENRLILDETSLNGFELAKYLFRLQEFLETKLFTIPIINLYIVFIVAILSLLIMFIRVCVEKDLYSDNSFAIDLVLLFLIVISGLKVFNFINENTELLDLQLAQNFFMRSPLPGNRVFLISVGKNGITLITFGWILSFIFLLLGKEENFYKKAAREAVLEATKNSSTLVLEKVTKTISLKEVFTSSSACCYYCFFVLFILGGFLIYL